MKKILIAIPLIVALLLGIIYYQRQQVAKDLQSLLQGKSYASYGMQIEILPGQGEVQGWLRPAIRVPQVKVDLSAWGLDKEIILEDAVASRELWSQENIRLELKSLLLAKKFHFLRVFAELSSKQGIVSLGSEKFLYYKVRNQTCLTGDENETLEILSPKWRLGAWQGTLPDQTEFSWKQIQFSRCKPLNKLNQGEMLWNLGPMRLSLNSQRLDSGMNSGNFRRFDILWQLKGGEYRGAFEISEIKDFELRENGKLLELNGEGKQQARSDLKELFQGGPWKQVLQQVLLICTRLELEFHEGDWRWQGLRSVGDLMRADESVVDGVRSLVSPVTIQHKNTFRSEGFAYEFSVRVDQLEFNLFSSEKSSLILGGIELQDQADYRGLQFRDLFQDYLQDPTTPSISALLFGQAAQLFIKPQQLLSDLLKHLSHYPNEKNFSLNIDQIDYAFGNYTGQHQNNRLVYFLRPRDIGYEIQSDFNIKYLGQGSDSTRLPFKNAKARLAMGFKLPWEKLLRLSRQVNESPETYPQLKDSLAALLKQEQTAYDFDFLLSLGQNYFDLNWNSEITFPLGEFLKVAPLPKNTYALKNKNYQRTFKQKLIKAMEKAWLEKGILEAEVQIDRWSKLQAMVAKELPQSVFGLALLTPFGQIDGDLDTFRVKVEYKDKQLLLNEKPDENLDKILQPFINFNSVK